MALQTQGQLSVPTPRRPWPRWLNRNVFAMGLTSFLGDAGYEMATVLLPGFFAVLGLPAAALGTIEGVADATSSFVKLGAGWLSDRLGHRKTIAVAGYFLSGTSKALFAFAYNWPLILAGRVIAWFGRGIRGPLRDAMLAESVPAQTRGKAFGFHRAGDTAGAIIGPLIGVALLSYLGPHSVDPSRPFRIAFLLTLIPGLASVVTFAALVHETRKPGSRTSLWASVGTLPRPFGRFLLGVGIFGAGDYSHTLMILAATQLLAPQRGVTRAAAIAGLLYVLHNVLYALTAYPIGALSDKRGRRGLLSVGYALGAIVALGFAAAFWSRRADILFIAFLFMLAGAFVAIQDALEGAMTADLVPEISKRGVAYGVTGSVNGVGDLISSAIVGIVWSIYSPILAFAYAAVMMASGAIAIQWVR
ncbi:MAG: MFS transporter [Acidobacteria bacterium]|nr:MAG: MFS transporter [Acidobacteriota bacterium]